MCGIDCAKQSVGQARSPKSDFGVAGAPTQGGGEKNRYLYDDLL